MLESMMALTHATNAAESTSVSFPLRLRRAWPREVSRLGLQYVDAAGRVVPGQWHMDPEQTRTLFKKLDRSTKRAVLVGTGESLVVLQPDGVDCKLPALDALLERSGATLITHRPGRRAVVQFEEDGRVHYAKALRPSRVGRVLRANRFVAEMEHRAFEIAAIDRADEQTGLVMMRELDGENLHDLVRTNTTGFVAGCRAAGQALQSLHVAAPDWLATHDASAEIDMLQDRVKGIEYFVPEARAAVARVCQGVFESLREGAGPTRVVHRDFYDKQVVIDQMGQPGLLDFDTLGAGEAALDVANMLGHLELRVLQGNCTQETAAEAARAFLDGYSPSEEVMARVQAYLDATRLRLAMLYAYWPKWAGLTPRLLETIGSPPVSETSPRLCAIVPARSVKRTQTTERNHSTACPLVFVVGCPRSGTTMLERMLDAHHELAMTHETHWVTRYAKRRRDLTREGCVLPETLDKLYTDYRFTRMAPPREQIERLMDQGPLKYRRFVRVVFDHFRRTQGKSFVGDKSTGGYLRNIQRLREVCPSSKIVHLVRDGRDVCLSMLNWPKADRAAGRFPMFKDDPVATTAAWWQWHVRAGLEQGRSLGPDVYREFRYEQIVQEPDRQCAALCAFLRIENDPGMVQFHAGRSKPGQGKSANAAWLAPTPGLRDWRTQMDPKQIEMFEAIAGETLDAFGYERQFPRVSPEMAQLAAERVARWEKEFGRRVERPICTEVLTTPRNT
jgi:Ser/Thr protein kinase RdoA (MazF antagonist)